MQCPAVTACNLLMRTPPHFPFPTLIRACQGKLPKPAGSPSWKQHQQKMDQTTTTTPAKLTRTTTTTTRTTTTTTTTTAAALILKLQQYHYQQYAWISAKHRQQNRMDNTYNNYNKINGKIKDITNSSK